MRAPQVHVVPAPAVVRPFRWRVFVDARRLGRRWFASSAQALVREQRDAIAVGREIAKRLRAELVVHGRDGKIRRKDSFGHDPRRSKG